MHRSRPPFALGVLAATALAATALTGAGCGGESSDVATSETRQVEQNLSLQYPGTPHCQRMDDGKRYTCTIGATGEITVDVTCPPDDECTFKRRAGSG